MKMMNPTNEMMSLGKKRDKNIPPIRHKHYQQSVGLSPSRLFFFSSFLVGAVGFGNEVLKKGNEKERLRGRSMIYLTEIWQTPRVASIYPI